MYRRQGLDCPDAKFTLDGYPEYKCPVEVEERSSGFNAVHHVKSGHHSQRVVLLCMNHDARDVLQRYIDIIDLRELERVLKEVA